MPSGSQRVRSDKGRGSGNGFTHNKTNTCTHKSYNNGDEQMARHMPETRNSTRVWRRRDAPPTTYTYVPIPTPAAANGLPGSRSRDRRVNRGPDDAMQMHARLVAPINTLVFVLLSTNTQTHKKHAYAHTAHYKTQTTAISDLQGALDDHTQITHIRIQRTRIPWTLAAVSRQLYCFCLFRLALTCCFRCR